MNDHTPTGHALADALGGTFDDDNGTVRFVGRNYFVRCAFTGRVQLVTVSDGTDAEPPISLGMMSEGVDTLAHEFFDALRAAGRRMPFGVEA